MFALHGFADAADQRAFPVLGRLEEAADRKPDGYAGQGDGCRLRLVEGLGAEPPVDAQPRKRARRGE